MRDMNSKAAVFIAAFFIPLHCMGQSGKTDGSGPGKMPEDICPALTPEGWERSNKAVVEGFMHAYQPCVVEVPDPVYPYRMWFFCWIAEVSNPEYAGCDAIYFARSKELDHWEVYCKDGSWDTGKNQEKWASVLHASADKEKYYDAFHTGDPSVVFRDGIFYMAYSATSRPFTDPDSPDPIEPPMFSNLYIEGYPSRMIQCIMGATSKDGIHWIKTEKPLLIAETDNKYPPDPCPDRIGDFHRPCLLWDDQENVWKLYFDYHTAIQGGTNEKWTPSMDDFIAGRVDAGMAVNRGDFSTGNFTFAHPLERPLLYNWPNPEVARTGACYYAFSDAFGYDAAIAPEGRKVSTWQKRQLQVAHSKDGLKWEKLYTLDPDPGVDANHVPQTLVCKKDGEWWLYLFYSTQVGWRQGDMVYPLFETGEYNWFYDQIRYMRQKIYQPKQ
jgi:predicted GH43/DUF377 family glycosyl hydrolase